MQPELIISLILGPPPAIVCDLRGKDLEAFLAGVRFARVNKAIEELERLKDVLLSCVASEIPQ